MHALFSKSLGEINSGDVDDLAKSGHPETEEVEFKKNVPSRQPKDRWYDGATSIGEHGRNKLLGEIIAFANAHGGHLLLGIDETDDHPRRAKAVVPIPRCADLAENLKLQIRDCIEPGLSLIGVRGIPMDNSGNGVVVVRIPQSRAAPHRLRQTNECFMRHSDRCETMTMREIQDLTIQRARGDDRINMLFSERRDAFHEWMRGPIDGNGKATGCRVTLVPSSELYLYPLHKHASFRPRMYQFKATYERGGNIEIGLPEGADFVRPIVRGVRYSNRQNNPDVLLDAHTSGLIEVLFRDHNHDDGRFYEAWILGVVCNGLQMANDFRCAAGAPEVEYQLEFEVMSQSLPTVPIFSIERYVRESPPGNSPASPCLYPRMSLGDLEHDKKQLVEYALADIRNSCGVSFSERVVSVTRYPH